MLAGSIPEIIECHTLAGCDKQRPLDGVAEWPDPQRIGAL